MTLNTSNTSDVSDTSATPELTPEQIIDMTQPSGPGKRNAYLLNLARGLKFEAMLKGRPIAQIKPYVEQWYSKAKPVINTKDFTTTWADFLRAWETCSIPLTYKAVELAFAAAARQARDGDLPACADQFDLRAVQVLVGACRKLSSLRPDGGFFLSSHLASTYLDLAPVQALRFLKMLVSEELLELVKTGNSRSANRYRWKGD